MADEIAKLWFSLGLKTDSSLINLPKVFRNAERAVESLKGELASVKGVTGVWNGIDSAVSKLNNSLDNGYNKVAKYVSEMHELGQVQREIIGTTNELARVSSKLTGAMKMPDGRSILPTELLNPGGSGGRIGPIAAGLKSDSTGRDFKALAKSAGQGFDKSWFNERARAEKARGISGPGNAALDALSNDLESDTGPSRRGLFQGNWKLAHAYAQRHADNREYLFGNPGVSIDGSGSTGADPLQPVKKRSIFSRLFGGGGGDGGGGKGRGKGGVGGGGRGSWSDRYGPLGALSSLRRVVMGAGLIQGATVFGGLADTYARLQMRLVGLTGSQEAASKTFEKLRTVAKNTNSSLESTTEGYVRIRNATSEMNLSEEDSMKLMTNLNLMLATSGASASEAKSGMMQLTQAFAKGRLDGDEFRSIAENMPNILKALGKELKVSEGQLRRMSRAGELTRDKLVKMLLNVKGLQKPVDTFATTWQKFKNDMMVSIGRFSEQNNLVGDFQDVLTEVAKVLMDYVIPAFGEVLKFLKEHNTVLKVLVGMGVASVIWSIGKAFLGFPLSIVGSIIAKLWELAAAERAVAAAGAAGAGAGAAGAGGAGAASKSARVASFVTSFLGKGGILPVLENPINLLDDDQKELMLGDGPDSIQGRIHRGVPFDDLFKPSTTVRTGAGVGSSSVVNMGGVNINVNAQDGTDAGKQIAEEMEKHIRNAGATFNR